MDRTDGSINGVSADVETESAAPAGRHAARPAAMMPVNALRSAPGHAVLADDAMEAAGIAAGADPNLDGSAIALAVPQARAEYSQATGGALDGAGLKIGILSDSFDLGGGEAADIAAGALPGADMIHVVQEGSSGNDEGRAMAELIHQIAPAAQIYFYTATGTQAQFATGIDTLVGEGVNAIVDDISYTDEPFYQETGVITQAVERAVTAGVDYFAAASNGAANFYEAKFSPMMFALPGIGLEVTHDVTGGSPYEAVALGANAHLDFALQWTQPFGSNGYDLGVALYSYDGASGTYKFVSGAAYAPSAGGPPVSPNPEVEFDTTLSNAAGPYYLAFYESTGSAPPGTFKIISFADSNAAMVGAGSRMGSGTVFGHLLAPGINTVAAVNVAATPSAGVATPVVEPYSAAGPGETYYDAAGAPLPAPGDDATPDFAATDGSATTVGGFTAFDGTSAAAPNAAAVGLLLLQADPRLATGQVTYLLEQSAIATASRLTGGAGLIQADAAVAGALTAATTAVWTAQGGSTAWSDPANWSDSARPGAASAVQISDGIGLLTTAYDVTFDTPDGAVASLDVDGGGAGALPTLSVQPAYTLTTGRLTVGSGAIDVAGALTDIGALTGAVDAASGAGAIVVSGGARLSIAGAAAGPTIEYGGVGGRVVLGTGVASTLASGLTAAITGFGVGDGLDLAGLALSSVGAVHVAGASVTVVDAAGETLAALTLSGAFSQLLAVADGAGGTAIVACYAHGTRIAVPGGERPVQDLRADDEVLTSGGRVRRVRWAGRRSYGARFLAANPQLRPIRFCAGSLGGGLPRRDLLVSPEHAMFLEGVLVPARLLVNGGTIAPDPAGAEIRYSHIELDTHDLLLAEGAASETFVDCGNRGVFHNALEAQDWEPRPPAVYCAPRVESGYALEAIRRRIASIQRAA